MGLADESILSDDLLRQLISVGEVDVLVGLPTHNHAKTAGHIAQMIRTGLLKYFPRQRAAILNADAGSRDGTPELVQAASISDARDSAGLLSLRTLHCISARYSGNPGKGTALQTIVASAELLRARACAVITPESSSITPDWIDRLLRPVYREGADFVTPIYRRHAFEGILITNLLYPMVRALYGKRVREPHPADFGFSGLFGSHLLGQEMWSQDAGQAGVEICFTAAAIAGGYRLQQTFLGPKGHVEQQSADLVLAMRQTLGALFWSLDQYFAAWSASQEIQAVPTLGAEYEVTTESMRVNRKRLYEMFCSGVADLEPVLTSILTSPTLEELKRCAAAKEDTFRYGDELWVKTIYQFAASYHRTVISRDHIIQALVPLYRGRVHTFLMRNRGASAQQVEQHIEALCLEFERLKPYLLELWAKQEGGS
jgi:hypothetical protein